MRHQHNITVAIIVSHGREFEIRCVILSQPIALLEPAHEGGSGAGGDSRMARILPRAEL